MSSLHAYLWAMDQEPDTTAEKMVLLALAHCCNDGHGADANVCFPGQETIAKFARCSVDTVRRALKKLASDGYIKVEPATDTANGQRLFNRYRLMFEVTTKSPSGDTKTHRANCMVEETPARANSPSHAQDASLEKEAESPPCKLHDGHHANHHANCGPNLKEEYLYSTARAGACEAGASPARAEGASARLILRPGDQGWSSWMEHLPAPVADQAHAAGAIEVPFRFPGKDSRLIAIVQSDGVAAPPTEPAKSTQRAAPALAVRCGDPSWQDWLAHIGPERAARAEAAGEIAVTARWPRDGARFIGVVSP